MPLGHVSLVHLGVNGVLHPISCTEQIAPHGPIRTFFPHDKSARQSACPEVSFQCLPPAAAGQRWPPEPDGSSGSAPRPRCAQAETITAGSCLLGQLPTLWGQEFSRVWSENKGPVGGSQLQEAGQAHSAGGQSGPELGDGVCGVPRRETGPRDVRLSMRGMAVLSSRIPSGAVRAASPTGAWPASSFMLFL